MKKNITVLNLLLLSAISLFTLAKTAFAADCPTDIKAVTSSDPSVLVEVLMHQTKPLTKCELNTEAEAWTQLLKAKITEISSAEVAAIYKGKEIEKTEEAKETLDVVKAEETEVSVEQAGEEAEEAKKALTEAQEAEQKLTQDKALQEAVTLAKNLAEKEDAAAGESTEVDLKTALIKHITALMAERTALIDRLNVVLTEWAAKGGDIAEYEAYIQAVSGIKVDLTDVSATWTTMTGWLLSEEGGLRWVANLIQFIAIVILFYLLSILAGKATEKACSKSKHFSTLLREFLVLTARRLVLFMGFFIGLSALEVNIGPVLAIIGAAGFVIAFALQNSLSNFASGILMLVYRPFDIDDMIKVAGVLGVVKSMNLLSTQLRTPDNQLVIVPNNSVWGDVIVNVTGIACRRVDLVFGIGYSDDIDKTQKVLEEILSGHERVLKKPEPIVKLHELGDSSVNFVCRPWVRPDDYWDVYWDITRAVKQRFDAEGISIPFPQRDVHLFQQAIESK